MLGTNATGGYFGNDWANQSFREKYGDSLFKTDSQRRLDEYSELDVGRVQMAIRRGQDRVEAQINHRSSDRLGVERSTTAPDVAQSFQSASGAQFKAMHLRA